MTRLMLLLVVVVGACGGGPAPPASRPVDEPFEGHLEHESVYVAPPPPAPLRVDLPPEVLGDDVLAPAGASAAATEPYDAAVRAYEVGDFSAAIEGFTRAYELEPHDEYLFDLAQAHRLLGDARTAMFFYKRYHAAATRSSTPPIDVLPAIEAIEEALAEQAP